MSNVNYDALTDIEWENIRSQRAVRLSIARNSFYWFFHLYMGHYIKYPTAEFQKQMMADVTNPDIEQLVIVAFRESGKSTIITTALPLWAAIGEMQKKYIVIVSQTQNQAQQHLANIVQELETNDLIRKDFWPYDYEENETGVSAIKLPRLGVRIIAVSREQGVRGLRHGPHRPDLIIADDVEDSRTVKTREGRDRNFAWFTGELLPLGSDNTKFITVGNLLHEDSLLMRLRAGMESGERNGAYREYPIERDGVSLWPERYPDKDSLVMLERRISDRVRFEREYRLHLVPDDDQIIFPDMIHYYDKLPDLLRGQRRTLVIGVDLAISEKDSADCTAMVTLDVRGYGESMRIYVLPHPVNRRMQFPATMDMIRELNSAYGNPKFFVETTAYQEALVQALNKDVIDVTGVHPNQDKRTRLNMIADKIQRGVILFPKYGSKELVTQLVGFGIEKHDDLVDALTIAVIKIATEDKKGGTASFGSHPVWDNWGPDGRMRRRS
tara:strand:+ start:315 stop:1805 length:1491 start_codon:yes stop_codon:yes gene_type:complete